MGHRQTAKRGVPSEAILLADTIFIQILRMGKSTCHMWVNVTRFKFKGSSLQTFLTGDKLEHRHLVKTVQTGFLVI